MTKLTCVFVALALVFLATPSSGASVHQQKPEMRQWWFDILQHVSDQINSVRDRIHNGLKYLKSFITNTNDKILQTNAKAQECLEKFRKDLQKTVDPSLYNSQSQYATYVDGVVNSAANAANISEFQQDVDNMAKEPTLQSIGKDLVKLMQRTRELAEARVRCTLEAYGDAFNGQRGNNSALTSTEGSNAIDATTRNPQEETTTDDVKNVDSTTANIEEVTGANDESTTTAEEVTVANEEATAATEEATAATEEATAATEEATAATEEATAAAEDATAAAEEATVAGA